MQPGAAQLQTFRMLADVTLWELGCHYFFDGFDWEWEIADTEAVRKIFCIAAVFKDGIVNPVFLFFF